MSINVRISRCQPDSPKLDLNMIGGVFNQVLNNCGFSVANGEKLRVAIAEQAFYEDTIFEAECIVCESSRSRNSDRQSRLYFRLTTGSVSQRLGINWCRRSIKNGFRLELLSDESFISSPIQLHEKKRLKSFSLGTMLKVGQFYESVSSEDWRAAEPKVTFEHDYRKMKIEFMLRDTSQEKNGYIQFAPWQLIVEYDTIHSASFDFIEDSKIVAYFRTKSPPEFYRAVNEQVKTNRRRSGPGLRTVQRFIRQPQKELCDNNSISLTFDLYDDENCFNEVGIWEMISRLRSRSDMYIYFISVHSEVRSAPPNPVFTRLFPFNVYWLLKALLSRGDFVGYQFNSEFLAAVRAVCLKNAETAESSLEMLLGAVDEHRNITLLNAFQLISQQQATSFSDMPSNYVRVRKIMVTPTRQLLMAPEVSKSNRVLNEMGEDYAVRVIIRNDNGKRIGSHCLSENSLRSLVLSLVENGCTFEDRHYQFLGWSNSQLRDHGFYLSAKAYDSECMRKIMGDFSNVRNVAKYMSKFALCFTQTQRTVDVSPIAVQKDFKCIDPSTGKNHIFSDGIGRISRPLAITVCQCISAKHSPCALQIRYAGSKGMVVVDPTLNPDGPQLILRESMVKFEGLATNLEVVKASHPNTVCLNRPLIMILDEVSRKQGAATHERVCQTIHTLLDETLMSLAKMLVIEEESVKALNHRTTLNIDVSKIKSCGFQLTNEPFFRGLLTAKHQFILNGLQTKCTIDIPPNWGRTMFGVLDETGELKYGEVFVQFSKNVDQPGGKVLRVKGKVMVTKNPCHVPGDVRLLTAVSVESLQHLVDVIVFPRQGSRPHPDEMAGSDLDGDEYSVFWDKNMIFEYNEEAANYDKPVPPELTEPVRLHHIGNFFSQYILEDKVGLLCNAHLVLADQYGLYHDHCIVVAGQCSVAVDFAKTGVPADQAKHRVFKYPDYMQKTEKPTYKSKKLLGQLHRKIKVVADIIQLSSKESDKVHVDYFDHDLVVSGWQEFQDEAAGLYKKFVTLVQSLMDQYGIKDEFQLISGFIVYMKNRICDHEKENFSVYDTERIIKLRLEKIFAFIRKEFAVGFDSSYECLFVDNLKVHQKASACYFVAYRSKQFGMKTTLLSFPWLFWDILCSIKYCRQASPDVQNFEQTITQKLSATLAALWHPGDDGVFKFYYVAIGFLRPCEELMFVGDRALMQRLMFIFQDTIPQPWKASFTYPQLQNDVGQFILMFVKFLASQDFLTFGDSEFTFDQRKAMNEMAFKAFHHICYTSSFHSLNLINESNEHNWAISEFGPMVIEVNERSHLGMLAKRDDEHFSIVFAKYFEKLTGMQEIRIRVTSKAGEFIRYAVVGVGTLNARNRFVDILTTEGWEGKLAIHFHQ